MHGRTYKDASAHYTTNRRAFTVLAVGVFQGHDFIAQIVLERVEVEF